MKKRLTLYSLLLALVSFITACSGGGLAGSHSFIDSTQTQAVSSLSLPTQTTVTNSTVGSHTSCAEPQMHKGFTPYDTCCIQTNGNQCGTTNSGTLSTSGSCDQNGTCGPCGADTCTHISNGIINVCDSGSCGYNAANNPPHQGVGVPTSNHVSSQYQQGSIYLVLSKAGASMIGETSTNANTYIRGFAQNDAMEDMFGGDGAIRVAWQSSYNALFNGSGTPSLQTLASNPNTLVRFAPTQAGATAGYWWTQISSVVDEEGHLLAPGQIQQVLALPQVPAWMGIGGQIPNGSTTIFGTAASNSFGPGGAAQLWSSVEASAAGAVEALSGIAGELDKRRAPSTSKARINYPL